MNLAEIFKFMSDFKISVSELKSRDQIKTAVKQINDKMEQKDGKKAAPTAMLHQLDVVGFIEFMLQLGYHSCHTEKANPDEFMALLFAKIRENNQQLPQLNKFFAQLDKLEEKKARILES